MTERYFILPGSCFCEKYYTTVYDECCTQSCTNVVPKVVRILYPKLYEYCTQSCTNVVPKVVRILYPKLYECCTQSCTNVIPKVVRMLYPKLYECYTQRPKLPHYFFCPYNISFKMHIIGIVNRQYLLIVICICIIHCTMYNVQCTMYNAQCTIMYNVQCTMYNVQCTMYNVQ